MLRNGSLSDDEKVGVMIVMSSEPQAAPGALTSQVRRGRLPEVELMPTANHMGSESWALKRDS